MKKIPLRITFDFENKRPCFGSTLVREDGKPDEKQLKEIYINAAAIIMTCHDNPEEQWAEITAETILHEVLHQIQAELERGFEEYEIEKAIEEGRK
jgi:hypothetical protein